VNAAVCVCLCVCVCARAQARMGGSDSGLEPAMRGACCACVRACVCFSLLVCVCMCVCVVGPGACMFSRAALIRAAMSRLSRGWPRTPGR
jgi:hypothetical protein